MTSQSDRGAQFLGLWMADQRATDEQVEQQKRDLGAVCPVCGATYLVRYGQHESAYFVIHPLGACLLEFDSHHAGAQTEEQALELFSKREEMPRLATPLTAAVPLRPVPPHDSQSEEEKALFEALCADRGVEPESPDPSAVSAS